MRRLAVCLLALLACSSTTATAATIQPTDAGPTVVLQAKSGEQNHVRAWLTSSGHLIIRDAGAPLTAIDPLSPGNGCTQLSTHTVDCGAHSILAAALGNQDDWLSFDVFNPAYELSAMGHAGSDWIRGGAGRDYIEAETAYGRGGNDWLRSSSVLADGGAGNDRCDPTTTGARVRCER